jgi:hypothetical protein
VPAFCSAVATGPETPAKLSGVASARALRASFLDAVRGRGRRVDGLAEHRLDRRDEHELVAVVAGPLGDRADRLGDAVGRVDALDRRAREALGDAGVVHGRTADPDEDRRVRARDDVDDVDLEGRDVGPADDAVARAAHPALHAGQRHDRVARRVSGRGDEQGQERGEARREAHAGHGWREQ